MLFQNPSSCSDQSFNLSENFGCIGTRTSFSHVYSLQRSVIKEGGKQLTCLPLKHAITTFKGEQRESMPSSKKYKQNKGNLMAGGLFQFPSKRGILHCDGCVDSSTWSLDITAGSRLVSKIHLSWVKSAHLIYRL